MSEPPPAPATNSTDAPPPAPFSWPALLPLAAVWCCAALPVLLYLIHLSDPVLAVEVANTLSLWTGRALLVGGAVTLVGLLAFPPFPAWVRRAVDRVRRSWTVDRGPMLQALKDLEHFETAQKHFEVARLAWIRTDLQLVGPHAARAVELDPSMPQAHHLLGQFLLRVGALPQAYQAFSNAERLDPGHAFGESLLLSARAAALAGRLDEALCAYEQHAASHGGGHRSHYFYGQALAAAGRPAEAAREFARAAADPGQRLPPEEAWYRALARVKRWRYRGQA